MSQSKFVIDDRETPRFRVHRSAMVEPGILDEERRKVFDESWLFVGHESEIPKAHDFRVRNVGGRPIIMSRHTDGSLQVFVNSCPHRGMQIETRPEGNGRFLKCFYHGWSFNTAGDLVAIPDEDSYGPNFDRQNLCLSKPKFDSYRGFVFLSWSNDIVDLQTYLAGACDILDLFADQSETGMRVIAGTHLYAARANWKLLSENSYDGYHALTTHHRYLAMLKESGKDLGKVFGGSGGAPALGYDLGNGHAVISGSDGSGGRNTGLGRDLPPAALEKQVARRNHFVELYGEAWTNRMFASRNVVIFPNLAIVDLIMGITIRTYYPISPDYMEVTAWSLQPSDDEPELQSMRQENFLTFWGPAGLATPDDIEALERCQKGFAAYKAAPWSDISRGMVRERPNFADEVQMRTFWREWDRRMTGTVHPPEIPQYQRAGRVGWPKFERAAT